MMSDKLLFPLGRIVITSGVAALGWSGGIIKAMLTWHGCGNYGTLSAQDRAFNRRALRGTGGSVMSVYVVEGIKIWVITDAVNTPEAVTTVLLPEEY